MKKNALLAALLVGALGFLPAYAGDGNSRTSKESVYWFADGSDTGGESRLTRTRNMVLVLLEAEMLVPGHAHTLWFIVFNRPNKCVTVTARDMDGNPTAWHTTGVCDDDDFFPEGIMASQLAVGNATGNVAKDDGTAEFGGRLVRNRNLDGHQVVFGAGFDSPYLLTNKPKKAEVHLVVQTHGPALGVPELFAQLADINANCNPGLFNEPPDLEGCADIQFAVHKAVGHGDDEDDD